MPKAPNPGRRIDYSRNKRPGSPIKFYIVAIIMGAIIGLAYIKRAEIQHAVESLFASNPPPAQPAVQPEPEKKEVPEVKPPEPPAEKPKDAVPPPVEHKTPAVQPELAGSPQDEAQARKIIADSKALTEKFDFAGASKRIDAAAALKLGPAVKNEVKLAKSKATEFDIATRHISISDYAQNPNAVVVETIDGVEWRGLKLREDDDKLYLQVVSESNPATEGVQKLPIPKNELRRTTPLPLAKRQADFAEMVLNLEGVTTFTHSTDFYDLVYLSKRLGLGRECLSYLNRAFDGGKGHEPDPHVGDSFRGVVVRRAIGRATLLMAGNRRTQVELELKKLRETLPGYAAADEEISNFRTQVMNKVSADFQPSVVVNEKKTEMSKSAQSSSAKPKLAGNENEIELGVSRVTGNGAAAPIVERANAKFEEGMSTIRKYKPGVGGNKEENNRNLTLARALLQDAIDIYEQAIKQDPNNKAIRDRQQTANEMVYFCNKNMIL